MYPLLPHEHLIENRTCKKCNTVFSITDKDMEFYEKVSPSFPSSGVPTTGGGVVAPKKYLIPPPTLCPDCRAQRRLAWHNERKLYKRKCDATGKEIISIYSPDKPFTVYHQDYWWSDKWDPMSYGREFDLSRSFFDQYFELFQKIPKQGLIASECENSEYLNFVWRVKDCYLISAASFDEDCYYGNRITKSKNCVDTFLVKESENCYACVDTFNSYGCSFSEHIYHCHNSAYLSNCSGCSFCFLCINLTNKKYCIKNIEYSELAYFEELKKYTSLSYEERDKERVLFFAKYPRKESYIFEGDGYGNNLKNAHSVKNVFDGDDLENVAYSAFVDEVSDSMDVNYGYGNTHLQYDCLGTGEGAHNCLFCINTWPNISNLFYCDTCAGCSYCFGCIGLRNKSYCILNRQYTKEEYEILVPKIVEKMMIDGEWGEFFPASMSPFGYNETVANEYFPLTREEVVGNSPLIKGDVTEGQGDFVSENLQKQNPPNPLYQGGMGIETFLHGLTFNWSDYEAPFPSVSKIIPAEKLPDTIDSIPDDILNWAIECEVSKKPFRIIKQELEFYRKHNIAIPRRHPDVRHMERMKMRNPRKLYERKCDKCNKNMITTYSPERKERVYCEECYEKEVLS